MFKAQRSAWAVLSAALVAGAAFQAVAQNPVAPPPAAKPGIEDSIFNSKPTFLVAAEVNHATREYREGDHLTIKVTSEVDAYLYVLYETATGETYQVFPNQLQRNNLVKARQTVRVPGETDLFRWRVGAPYGKEVVKVIATKEPVNILSKPELSKGRFNRVSGEELKGVVVELEEDKPVEWGETDVILHTYENTHSDAVAQAKRFGVFFGVSHHRYDDILVRGRADGVSEEKASHDLTVCHRDAQKFAEVMRTVGRLDGIKIYTNEEATKENMEDAITRWLPSVARPGDTVVVYFSGHTGQMPDKSGDEADGLDEFIVPHDIFGPGEYVAMSKLYKEDKLKPRERKEFENIRDYVKSLGENPELKLLESTAVTDDLMARWMQRLDGRQVVFISDSCHSGGFAEDETNFKGKSGFSFEMLSGEAVRLKNLGQGNHAIFCAAYANEVAQERHTQDLSVLTYCMIDFLNKSRGPQKLEACFESCGVAMEKYFIEWNQALERAGLERRVKPSHPFLINHCQTPVFLKP